MAVLLLARLCQGGALARRDPESVHVTFAGASSRGWPPPVPDEQGDVGTTQHMSAPLVGPPSAVARIAAEYRLVGDPPTCPDGP